MILSICEISIRLLLRILFFSFLLDTKEKENRCRSSRPCATTVTREMAVISTLRDVFKYRPKHIVYWSYMVAYCTGKIYVVCMIKSTKIMLFLSSFDNIFNSRIIRASVLHKIKQAFFRVLTRTITN